MKKRPYTPPEQAQEGMLFHPRDSRAPLKNLPCWHCRKPMLVDADAVRCVCSGCFQRGLGLPKREVAA